MKTIGLIFPHQLFPNHPVLQHTNTIYLIEDSLFFGDKHNPLKFHKQKIIFHRASMQAYKSELQKKGITVHYVSYDSSKTIVDILPEINTTKIVCVDPTDYLLERRLQRRFSKNITFLESPLFINSRCENEKYLETGKLFMHEFYKQQRKRLHILMDPDGPIGGRWSFDDENRKKIPKSEYTQIPHDPVPNNNNYIYEAKKYVADNFPNNPGNDDGFFYVVTREEALEKLKLFCHERLHLFGDYEDAIIAEHSQLYHSILSPYLNIGLISPNEVVQTILTYAEKHQIKINNVEGIIRQIIGWREFIRMVYEKHGTSMRNSNEWNHNNRLSDSWYIGKTELYPVDKTIKKTLDTGYAHHIERLMILGNVMFLCEINPNQVYNWFMEMYIDAYDWVMVPNVYGMTQSTQKGLMTTKPYISGSNYIKKMSDYSNGPWADVWDALYWSMIIKNLDELRANGRMHFVVSRAQKFTQEQKNEYARKTEEFLKTL